MKLLEKHQKEIEQICQRLNVKELSVFGSVLSNKFNESSDIDFIVAFYDEDPILYAENYFSLKFTLEDIFQRPIDLLEAKTIKNEIFREILNRTKKLVYAGKHKSMA
jgi:predicted nucleotidyltransferase